MKLSRESGRVFHNVGAQKENVHSLYVTEFIVGTVKEVIWRMNVDYVVDDILAAGTTNRLEKVHEES